MTPAEVKLWAAVRSRGLSGTKVRRQVPAGSWILDFAVPAVRLVIEVDGDTHAAPEVVERDVRRTAWLGERGWTVVRFSNREVLGNFEGVLTRLSEVIGRLREVFAEGSSLHSKHPHPSPLPTGEGVFE